MKFGHFIDTLHIESQMVVFQGISEREIFDIGQMCQVAVTLQM